jgi:two-component sensor histidine kinase
VGLQALGALGVAVGLIAEWVSHGPADVRHWLPDLATGWTLIAVGIVARRRRPDSPVGALLSAAGFAWFLGNLTAAAGSPEWLNAMANGLHRALLLHALLAFPTRRAVRSEPLLASLGYGIALFGPLAGPTVASFVLSIYLVVANVIAYAMSSGRFHRARLVALQAAVAYAAVLLGGVGARALVADHQGVYPALLVYEVSVCGVAVALLISLTGGSWDRGAVSDLVIDVGVPDRSSLEDSLGWALGDPTLRVRFAPAESVDGPWDVSSGETGSTGRPRVRTPVCEDDRIVAVIDHDAGALADQGAADAAMAAVRLAARNASLRARVERESAEVAASRLRLLRARDDEAARLEATLRTEAEPQLRRVADLVVAATAATQSASRRTALEALAADLTAGVEELRRLARGLNPSELVDGDLVGALHALVERSPVPVQLVLSLDDTCPVPPESAATAYYICAEGLANVTRHAAASRVCVSVAGADGVVRITVEDDGIGGADTARGSGLRNLAERVAGVGGSLSVHSPIGEGTRVTAAVPFRHSGPPPAGSHAGSLVHGSVVHT